MKTFNGSWNNPVNPNRNEIVFAHRNQDYGAYVIRRDYTGNLHSAFWIALILFSLPMALYYTNRTHAVTAPAIENIREVILMQEEFIPTKSEPLIPPSIPEPLKQSPAPPSEKFTTPLVTDDKDLRDDPPTQDKLNTVDAGTKTILQDSSNADVKSSLPDPDPNEGKLFTVVEEMPRFPGGEEARMDFMRKHMRYPAEARERNISGIVFINFIVSSDGQIRSIGLKNRIGGGCDEEALRVVQKMPEWNPGRQNGKAVSVEMVLPVRFKLR